MLVFFCCVIGAVIGAAISQVGIGWGLGIGAFAGVALEVIFPDRDTRDYGDSQDILP